MISKILIILCLFITTTAARPSKIEEDGLKSQDEHDVFIMKKSELKNGWCKTLPFKQTIKVDGCLPVTVQNN